MSLSLFVPNIFWIIELNICLYVTEIGNNCQSANNPGNKEIFAIFQRILYYPLLSLDNGKDKKIK